MGPTLETPIISPHRNTTEVTLTGCLTKVKADKQADDACDETNESDDIKLSKLVPDGAFFMGVKIEEREEKSCCNTAGGPGDDCQCERYASRTNGDSIQVDEETPSPGDMLCKRLDNMWADSNMKKKHKAHTPEKRSYDAVEMVYERTSTVRGGDILPCKPIRSTEQSNIPTSAE